MRNLENKKGRRNMKDKGKILTKVIAGAMVLMLLGGSAFTLIYFLFI